MKLALLALLSAGCSYDEGLVIADMTGTVVLPEEAATRTITHKDGTSETITDVRLIGPVYLGLYSGVQEGLQTYPHPEMGPMFQPGVPGDTYPYGGTSVGDIRYACFESLTCKVISGRFVDFDAMVSWFRDTLEMPILDQYGDEVDTGDYIRQTCYELMHYTTDAEIRLTATEDRNEDGVLDELDLDFVQRNDGRWEAGFTLWQQEYVPGAALWGWMDAPSETSYQFSTCNTQDGYYEATYSSNYYGGAQYPDLLNTPSLYISAGDWVTDVSGIHVYGDVGETPEINVNMLVTQ